MYLYIHIYIRSSHLCIYIYRHMYGHDILLNIHTNTGFYWFWSDDWQKKQLHFQCFIQYFKWGEPVWWRAVELIGLGLACEEQYPKALGHTVEELDVSEAGIISYHIISRYSLWGWDNQGSSCSQEHLGSMAPCQCTCKYTIWYLHKEWT